MKSLIKGYGRGKMLVTAVLDNYSRICLEVPRKRINNFSQNIRHPGWDSKQTSIEYKPMTSSPDQLRRSADINYILMKDSYPRSTPFLVIQYTWNLWVLRLFTASLSLFFSPPWDIGQHHNLPPWTIRQLHLNSFCYLSKYGQFDSGLSIRLCTIKFINVKTRKHCTFDSEIFGCGKVYYSIIITDFA
jgi:hypothetical protein